MAIVRVLLAAVAGICTYEGFTPNFWFLAILGIAVFVWSLHDGSPKARIFSALVFATCLYGPLVNWLTVVSVPASVMLVALCVFPWFLIAFYRPHSSHVISGVRLAACVAVIEAIHSEIPWGGFPWGLLAYSQLDGPLMPSARVGGEVVTTLLVVLVGYACFAALIAREFRLLMFCVVCIVVSSVTMRNQMSGGDVRVAVIQGNVPREGLSDSEQAARVFENHIAQTHRLAQDVRNGKVARPELVVWPENAADGDPVNNRSMFNQVQKVVDEINVPVLVGAAVWDGEVGPYNAGIMWLPHDGPNQRYEKNQLVPFGEYIPQRKFLEKYAANLGIAPNDFVSGSRSGVMTQGVLTFADVICFEVAYDQHIRGGVLGGAQFFTVQSNNATYAFSEQPMQQLQITRFRAIEHGRAFAVATTTGFSALIDSHGTLRAVSKEMRAETLIGNLDQQVIRQPVDRWGSGPWLLLSVAVLLTSWRRETLWKSQRSRNGRFGRVK